MSRTGLQTVQAVDARGEEWSFLSEFDEQELHTVNQFIVAKLMEINPENPNQFRSISSHWPKGVK